MWLHLLSCCADCSIQDPVGVPAPQAIACALTSTTHLQVLCMLPQLLVKGCGRVSSSCGAAAAAAACGVAGANAACHDLQLANVGSLPVGPVLHLRRQYRDDV